MIFTNWRLMALAVAIPAAVAGCNDEGMNYVQGPEDPSLQVGEQELAQVRDVLDEQARRDREAGIRPERTLPTAGPIASASPDALPEGHPPIDDVTGTAGAPFAGGGEMAGGAGAGGPMMGGPATGAADGGGQVASADGTIRLQMLEGTLPEGWRATPPSNQMRVAEIAIPDPGGRLKDAELVAFYFGPDQGGSVEANVQRWLGQMTQPDGRPTQEVATTERFDVNGIPVTLVEAPGTFAASPMMGGGTAQPLERWYLMGAIAETPQGPLFLKATGPDETLKANRDKMMEFLKSLRPAGAGGVAAGGTQRVETHAAAPEAGAGIPAAAGASGAAGNGMEGGVADSGAQGGTAGGGPANAAATGGGTVDMGVITGELPASWQSVQPDSSMRLAQFSIPPVAGDSEPGEVAVFYFGQGDGGGIEANIQRWYDQLQQPGGQSTAALAQREEFEANGMKVTLVDAPGNYTGMMMPGQSPQPKADYRLLGAIVETPQGAVFIKGTGPDRTMAENKDEMVAFLRTVQPK